MKWMYEWANECLVNVTEKSLTFVYVIFGHGISIVIAVIHMVGVRMCACVWLFVILTFLTYMMNTMQYKTQHNINRRTVSCYQRSIGKSNNDHQTIIRLQKTHFSFPLHRTRFSSICDLQLFKFDCLFRLFHFSAVFNSVEIIFIPHCCCHRRHYAISSK